jgi:putative flippase GtrA
MRQFLKNFFRHEMMRYILIGGFATLIDWSTFAVTTKVIGWHYQVAIFFAYSFAGIFHYTCNRFFTFQNESKKYASQIFLYVLVVSISLPCNLLIMTGLVHIIAIDPLYLRMLTTVLMLPINYFLHKVFTFNKKFFR